MERVLDSIREVCCLCAHIMYVCVSSCIYITCYIYFYTCATAGGEMIGRCSVLCRLFIIIIVTNEMSGAEMGLYDRHVIQADIH